MNEAREHYKHRKILLSQSIFACNKIKIIHSENSSIDSNLVALKSIENFFLFQIEGDCQLQQVGIPNLGNESFLDPRDRIGTISIVIVLFDCTIL